MLSFEYGNKIELVLYSRADGAHTIQVVGATREGPFVFTHETASGATGQTQRMAIPDIPIWVSVIALDTDIERGMVYANVNLEMATTPIHALVAGYVYGSHAITWPMASIEPSDNTLGIVTGTDLANPAAGDEISGTVPSGENWEIMAVSFSLVTDATVAARLVHFIFEVAGVPAYEIISNTNHGASLTYKYRLNPVPGAASVFDNNVIIMPMTPGMIIPGGDVFYTQTKNLQAGDNFGIPSVIYKKHIISQPF